MTIFGAMFTILFIIWIFRLFIELIKGIFVMIYNLIIFFKKHLTS
jgi:hypothetical protein